MADSHGHPPARKPVGVSSLQPVKVIQAVIISEDQIVIVVIGHLMTSFQDSSAWLIAMDTHRPEAGGCFVL
jgi:hypothetical protein